MKNYEKFLNEIINSKKIFEQAVNKKKISNIERFKNSDDIKSILKIYNDDITNIQTILKKIDYDDIQITTEDEYFIVEYDYISYTLLKAFEAKLFRIKHIPNILNKIFQDGYRDLFLEIEIHNDIFNKIDILNGLPNFLKNLGLGKKIYKKLIKDFNYISSFSGYEPSEDSDMTWNSILDDHEIFSFCNDNNIISFWYEVPYDEIINILSSFYKEPGKMVFDDDFLEKFNLTDDVLIGLLND